MLGAAHTIPMLKSQLQNVLPAYTDPPALITVESPCATAATKRASNETGSTGGSTLVGSNTTDSSYKAIISKPEDGSDGEEDTKVTTKLESSSNNDGANGAGKIGPSPSKANKAKL